MSTYIYKRKNGIYYICYRDYSGKEIRKSLKTKIKTVANERWKNFAIKNEYNLRLEDIYNLYSDYMNNNYSTSTITIYKSLFKNLREILGNIKLNILRLSDIEKYKSERLKVINPNSMNIELRCIKRVLKYFYRNGYIDYDYYKDITFQKIPERKKLSISKEEILLIINNIKCEKIKDVIIFAFYTGCRIQEILNLRTENINLIENYIEIINTENFITKTKKIRIIPLNKNILTIINKYYIEDKTIRLGYLFTKDNKQIRKDTVSKTFKRTVRRLGLNEDYKFHSLRHTFISNLFIAGIDSKTISELAGHQSITTTEKYAHTENSIKKSAINRLSL